jgi:hypothetical protein
VNTSRRFPPPWSVETMEACFIVRDLKRQALTYVYFEEEPRRRAAANLPAATKLAPLRSASPSYLSC